MTATDNEARSRYVVLIYERQSENWPDDMPPEMMAAGERHDARVADEGGRILAGIALRSAATATSIRGGVITDGPFVETKEALAGLYVLEARDLDHALELARTTPVADGGIEVRPLLDMVVEAG
jgi:hypothetical protein